MAESQQPDVSSVISNVTVVNVSETTTSNTSSRPTTPNINNNVSPGHATARTPINFTCVVSHLLDRHYCWIEVVQEYVRRLIIIVFFLCIWIISLTVLCIILAWKTFR